MSWRNEVTFDDLLSANDTQYDTIIHLEKKIESLKREVGNLKKEVEKVEDASDLMYDDLRDLAEYYSNTKLTAEEKLKQMESVFDSRFGFVNGKLNLE